MDKSVEEWEVDLVEVTSAMSGTPDEIMHHAAIMFKLDEVDKALLKDNPEQVVTMLRAHKRQLEANISQARAMQGPARVAPAEATSVPPGTLVVGPDGRVYRRKGTN
jgi:hypothetical protein